MLFNNSAHSNRVAQTVGPLYTRLVKESMRLQDYLKTVEDADALVGSGAEAEQFSNLYLRKLITQITSPRDLFCINGSEKLEVKPKRRSVEYTARYIAETLQRIYERVSIDDLTVIQIGSTHSRLYKNLDYYRMSLQIAARILEAESTQGKNDSVKLRLGKIRAVCDRLNLVPAAIVEQFDEKRYLQNNTDVRAAVAEGEISSGLEHFAIQGMQEALQGGRAAPGVDLGLAKSISSRSGAGGTREIMSALDKSGIFDAKWYKRTYRVSSKPLKHFCEIGYKQKNAPNAHFDMKWYLEQNPNIDLEIVNPAFHYVQYGESQGSMPAEYFEPLWYKEQYGVEGLALAHYVKVGITNGHNPNRFFDRAYYLQNNADVVKAKQDPVEHFYRFGWKERRNPSAAFDANAYVVGYLNNTSEFNPVTHALLSHWETFTASPAAGHTTEAHTDASESNMLAEPVSVPATDALNDIAGNIKFFANPGPDFELASAINSTQLKPRAKTVAFYLPQFHAFEENDKWWGTGFTEWRNVTRGTPRFAGHYQPRIPRDLGFYDLNNEQVIIDQSKMALANGIEAFCFYYYWFNGQRLLDMPLDSFANNAQIDQEFCIMWANENWTRTWDGFDSEVLMEQSYRDEDEQAFLEDTARYFKHERYMHVDGRPLFILYRPGLLPKATETLARWRDAWEEMLGVAPLILMVQGFGDSDPTKFGLDGAVEFPPHKVCVGVPHIQDQMNILDPNYSGQVLSYNDVIASSLDEKPPEYPLIKTVVPHWDNDARREGRGYTLHGSTPALYEKWLSGAMTYAEENPFENEPLVFVNAWNEWAEGAYLEPDVHYGHAYLNATKRAVYGLTSNESLQKILLVGHDAYKHGAQMLLMSMAETYKRQFGMDVTILLKEGGPLKEAYQQICNTVVIEEMGVGNVSSWLREQMIEVAICNTSVTGDLTPVLKNAGVKVVSLIHELPNLIEEYKLESNLQNISDNASHVVFPSNIVMDGFRKFVETGDAEQVINPQGTYKQIVYDADKRIELRSELGIGADEKMVLNVGYADLRKGFDIFLQAARKVVNDRQDVHFVWAGKISDDMERWVESDLDASMRSRIHLVGFTDRMSDYYSACDCLFLTSREDPYPTVVLEAMDVGLPVVLFKNATGFDSLISQYGYVVDRNDLDQTVRALIHSLYNDSGKEKQSRRDYVKENCQFDDYCFSLLKMLVPAIQKVSVVVPNYNYEEYMQDRLTSVFKQSYPIFETIVLDDCSTDDSVETIKQVAKNACRVIKVQPNESNSGNVFKQWRKGIVESRGDLLWIAEADDLAEPNFIADSVEAISPNTALTFCNSRQIDSKDEPLAPNYDYYYDTINKSLFSQSFEMSGPEFINEAMSIKNVIMNVSSVLWNKAALETALENVGEELTEYKLVGDWRLYLEVLSNPTMSVSYLYESLNVHRRHDESVTHSLDHDRHLAEIKAMHDMVAKLIKTDKRFEKASKKYILELKEQFGLDNDSKVAA